MYFPNPWHVAQCDLMVYMFEYITRGSLWTWAIIIQYDEWLTVTFCIIHTNVWHVAHCELVVCIYTDVHHMVHCDLVVSFDRFMTHGSQLTCGIFGQYMKYDLMWQRPGDIKFFKYCYCCNFCFVRYFLLFCCFFIPAVKVIQLTVSVNYLFTFSCLPLNDQMYDIWLAGMLRSMCTSVWHVAHCELDVYFWMDV